MSENQREGLRGAGDRLRSVTGNPRVKGMAKVFQGFKDFISRGNAVELAVGVVVGAAFTQVVNALQNALISPLIGWIFGKPNLQNVWDIGPYTWREPTGDDDVVEAIHVGEILNAVVQFLITAAAIYFLIVLPLNALAARRKRGAEEEPAAPAEDILLLQEIRDLLAQRLTPAVANDTTIGGAGTLPPAAGTGGVPPSTGPGTAPPPGAPPTIPPGS